MKYRYVLSLVLILALANSCKTFRFDGEPPAGFDATPPPDYHPVFIMKKEKYDKEKHISPKAIISNIDVRQPNSVKIKMHLIDSNYIYLTGVAKNEFRKFWCEVVDSFKGKETVIKKFKIDEVTDEDQIKTAIAVVMDHSGSMGDTRAYVVQDAVTELINNKKNEDAIALIKYDDKIGTESPLSYDKSDLLAQHQRIGLQGYGNLTAVKNGILSGLQELSKAEKGSEKAVVVFTDGFDNSSTVTSDTVIKFARANGTIICGIDFGDNINKDFMKSFADSTSGIYHPIYGTDEFKLVFQDIYNRLKNNYSIEFNPKEYGLHKIKVKLCFPYDTATAYATYDNTPDIGAIGMLPINFDFNKATIQKQSEDAIDNIYMLLTAYPKMEIELRGHTDSLNSTNDPDYNVKLSQKRADAVKQALVKKGINANRIAAKGIGEFEPIATNNTEEGRAKNRRTEFVILKR
jgi:outer membrane protein OmpA-like peptidoglycan-associated protein